QWAWIGREDAGAPESDGSASIDASAHAPMALREGLPPDALLWEGRLGPHAPVTLALLPSELPESRARTLLTPLRARAKQRWIRGPAGGGPTLRMSLEPRVPGSAVADPLTGGPDSPGPEATSVEDLNAGIEILRESPLLPPGEGDARRPGGFLAGLTEGRPTL